MRDLSGHEAIGAERRAIGADADIDSPTAGMDPVFTYVSALSLVAWLGSVAVLSLINFSTANGHTLFGFSLDTEWGERLLHWSFIFLSVGFVMPILWATQFFLACRRRRRSNRRGFTVSPDQPRDPSFRA